jgi:hypothetical protein
MICSTCNGRGEIGGFVGSIGSGAESYQTDLCPDCQPPPALNAIADVVLAYRPKPKSKTAKKRKRLRLALSIAAALPLLLWAGIAMT